MQAMQSCYHPSGVPVQEVAKALMHKGFKHVYISLHYVLAKKPAFGGLLCYDAPMTVLLRW